MCSVVGYIGKGCSRAFVMEGLSRLEYRGYDSAGFACLRSDDNRLVYLKSAGQLSNLNEKFSKNPIDGFVGIGHTRWATHGLASEKNAHPQFDCQKTLSVAHNGIVENHAQLRASLLRSGHVFHSDTDSEVIAHLFESFLITHTTFQEALVDLVNTLEGAFSFVSIMQEHPDFMVVVRKRSPLCIGIGKGEMFVASDLQAFLDKTKKVVFLPDESFALVRKDMVELYDFFGKPIPIVVQEVDFDWVEHGKRGHDHYMVKEIYEQKSAIQSTLEFLKSIEKDVWGHIGLDAQQAKDICSINMVACGTSWHAASIAQFFFETICMIPASAYLASEFRYKPFFPDKNGLYLAISQSGETADTLEALQLINSANVPTIGITNVASSAMVREAGGFLLTQAGQEVAVASTKAFSTQLTVLYWLAHRLAFEKGIISKEKMEFAEEDLLVAAEVLENSIENYKIPIIKTFAKEYASYDKAIFLGRNISYPFALEAALKLKEISYIFAQGYPAGELKHGPLALIDDKIPVFVFSNQSELIYKKILSNAIEVKSRGGRIVSFAFEGQEELSQLADLSFVFPKVKPLLGPLAMTGLMQFFMYQIAKQLKCPIDKPRNLAKSVTVE